MRNFLFYGFTILLITLASSVFNDVNAMAPGVYFYCEGGGSSAIFNVAGQQVGSGTTPYQGELRCSKFFVHTIASGGGGGSNGQQSNPALLQLLLTMSPATNQNNTHQVNCTSCPVLGVVYENDVQHL